MNLIILEQNCEARFYGLLFLCICACAFMAYHFQNLNPVRAKHLALNAFAHGCLVLSHPFGIAYSLVFFATVVLVDRIRKRWRPWAYGSFVMGDFALLLWISQFMNQRKISSPHAWVPAPSIEDFFSRFWLQTDFRFLFWPAALVVGVGAIVAWRWKQRMMFDWRGLGNLKCFSGESIFLWVLGLLLFAVIPAGWVASHLLVTLLFQPRYYIGVVIGWIVVCAALVEVLKKLVFQSGAWANPFFRRYVAAVVSGAIIVWIVGAHYGLRRHRMPEFPFLSEARHLTHLPVVVESIDIYFTLQHYSDCPMRYYYILDWEIAIHPKEALNSASDWHLMKAQKDHYPRIHNIVGTNEFLTKFDEFLLVDEEDRLWSDMRISREKFEIRRLGRFGNFKYNWLVHVRKRAGSSDRDVFALSRLD